METNATLARYQTLIEEQPENELLHFSLGKALFNMGNCEQAEIHLRKALGIKPDWMVVAMLLAQCAIKREATAEAISYYELALPLAIDQKHEGPEQEIRGALEVLSQMG